MQNKTLLLEKSQEKALGVINGFVSNGLLDPETAAAVSVLAAKGFLIFSGNYEEVNAETVRNCLVECKIFVEQKRAGSAWTPYRVNGRSVDPKQEKLF